jgi:hypothetical protein
MVPPARQDRRVHGARAFLGARPVSVFVMQRLDLRRTCPARSRRGDSSTPPHFSMRAMSSSRVRAANESEWEAIDVPEWVKLSGRRKVRDSRTTLDGDGHGHTNQADPIRSRVT